MGEALALTRGSIRIRMRTIVTVGCGKSTVMRIEFSVHRTVTVTGDPQRLLGHALSHCF